MVNSNRKAGNADASAVDCSIAGMDMVRAIRESVVGRNATYLGPYGPRRLVYADYTASGRLLSFIETYLNEVVYPFYGNTHTEISMCGVQTSHFYAEARECVRRSLKAHPSDDVVLFTGTGSTGAIFKLMQVLGLQAQWCQPSACYSTPAQDRKATSHRTHVKNNNESCCDSSRPIVLVGPYEHHSNEVLWRETIAEVVVVPECENGNIDLEELQRICKQYAQRELKIGSFSAGSNVTGIRPNVDNISRILHHYGFLAFFDYAGAGAYVDINMSDLDAIFLSPHKFIGGPGSPGVLVAKRKLFTNEVPTIPGGGTVSYVSPWAVQYDDVIEHREDGGTPAILQAIRCGLAFKIKDSVGPELIHTLEQRLSKLAVETWAKHPDLQLMGADRTAYWDADRLTITAFNVKFTIPGNDCVKALHPHFIAALLNDLYGIQARSGCSCAGPYGHRLLDIGQEHSLAIKRMAIDLGFGSMKPGWARVNFNYFIDDLEAAFIMRAVLQIATHGWKLLPQYRLNALTGQYQYCDFDRRINVRSMDDINIGTPDTSVQSSKPHRLEIRCRGHAVYKTAPDYSTCLDEALRIFHSADQWLRDQIASGVTVTELDYEPGTTPLPTEAHTLRWFALGSDAAQLMLLTNKSSPFQRTAARLPTVPTDVPHLPVLITVKCDEDDGDMVTPPMTPKETPRKQRRKPGDLVYDRPDSANRDIEPLGKEHTNIKMPKHPQLNVKMENLIVSKSTSSETLPLQSDARKASLLLRNMRESLWHT